MKSLFLKVFSIAIAIFFISATNLPDNRSVFSIDLNKSKVVWKGEKVTGEHTGTIEIEDGTVYMSENSLNSVSLNIDMSSIICTDIENETYNAKLINHLKSDDFFAVEKHPRASFKSTEIISVPGSEMNYNVTGDLTVKGITNSISFPAKITARGSTISAVGTAVFDRAKFDVKYRSGSFFEELGDKMIYDDVEITFEIEGSLIPE